MLTRVDVQSENPFFLEIRNAKPTDSIRLEKIEGLGPPDVNLFLGDFARDGGFYGGRRVPPRTITLILSLNPDYGEGETVDGLRLLLYKTFMDPFVMSDGLTLVLKDDTFADRYVQGYTEKFDGDIFSDDTTVMITMRCPNPYILDVAPTELEASGPTFPFDYEGSAETGFVITAEITTNTPVVTLDLNDGITMTINYTFLDDDILTIDTRRGQRRIQLTRTVAMVTTTTDILYALDSDSTWLELHLLNNSLAIHGADDEDIIANLTEIAFRGYHWGI